MTNCSIRTSSFVLCTLKSFVPKRFYRIRHGSPKRLIAYRQNSNEQCYTQSQEEDARPEFDLVSKLTEESIHRVPGQRCCQHESQCDQLYIFAREHKHNTLD